MVAKGWQVRVISSKRDVDGYLEAWLASFKAFKRGSAGLPDPDGTSALLHE